jgi:hypothetical protein
MALQFNQTDPLPHDGATVNPADFLEDWIAGADVWNFDLGSMNGGDLLLVYSHTEAPATNMRVNGMLWFQRGDGRLYLWDTVDPSGSYYSGLQGWIAISDRRELWVNSVLSPVALGSPMSPQNEPGTSNVNQTMILTNEPINYSPNGNPMTSMGYRPIWSMWPWDNASMVSTFTPYPSIMLCVALDSATTAAPFRAVEHGFCSVYMTSGESGTGGFLKLVADQSGVTCIDGFTQQVTIQSGISGGIAFGFLCDSAESMADSRVRSAFLFQCPMIGASPGV